MPPYINTLGPMPHCIPRLSNSDTNAIQTAINYGRTGYIGTLWPLQFDTLQKAIYAYYHVESFINTWEFEKDNSWSIYTLTSDGDADSDENGNACGDALYYNQLYDVSQVYLQGSPPPATFNGTGVHTTSVYEDPRDFLPSDSQSIWPSQYNQPHYGLIYNTTREKYEMTFNWRSGVGYLYMSQISTFARSKFQNGGYIDPTGIGDYPITIPTIGGSTELKMWTWYPAQGGANDTSFTMTSVWGTNLVQ